MEFILNPIVISVVVLCALCLARVNVLLALIAASLVAGLTGGLGLTKSMELLSGGFSANATTRSPVLSASALRLRTCRCPSASASSSRASSRSP